MKTNFLVSIFFLFLFSCGKKYQCNCYSTKQGRVNTLIYSSTERNTRKDHAETDCEAGYHNSLSFEDSSYCKIK